MALKVDVILIGLENILLAGTSLHLSAWKVYTVSVRGWGSEGVKCSCSGVKDAKGSKMTGIRPNKLYLYHYRKHLGS